MRVLVVRHAIAEDPGKDPRNDAERPLTEEGRRKMRRGAAGLIQLVPEVSAIWTSPYLRAAQTAAILGEAWGVVPRQLQALAADLSPADQEEGIVSVLRRSRGQGVRVLVGHEPSLGALVARWLTGREGSSWLAFKKGGAALVEFPAAPRPGTGQLVWLLPPGILRDLAS